MSKTKAPEQRTVDVDVGELSTEGNTLRGHAAVFNVLSEDLGGFRERLAPGAFSDVLEDDVRLLVDHEPPPLARTKAGTLRLSQDATGLAFEAELPNTTAARDLRESVSRGDIDGASFRFTVGEESWDGDVRTVTEVKNLMDITAATYPAYPEASIELRARPEATSNTTAADEPQEKSNDMSETNRSDAPDQAEERKAPEVKVTNEPAPVLDVEDRTAGPKFHSLAETFRSRGFPGETATIEWGEYRTATFGGTIDNLNPVRRDGVPLGADQRYAYPVFPQVAVAAGATSVQVLRQHSRTLAAGTAVVRDLAATTTKPEVTTAGTVITETLRQVAAVETSIPNVYLEQPAFNTMVEQDLRLSLNEGLDQLVLDKLATAGTATTATPLLQGIRSGITAVQAQGYSPDTVILSPANSETLDTLVSGISGGTSDFVFQPGQVAPGSIYGLNVRVATDVPAPVVVDSQAVGKLYVSPITLARFEQDAGATNKSTVRLEGHAVFGLERVAAAVRIATS